MRIRYAAAAAVAVAVAVAAAAAFHMRGHTLNAIVALSKRG